MGLMEEAFSQVLSDIQSCEIAVVTFTQNWPGCLFTRETDMLNLPSVQCKEVYVWKGFERERMVLRKRQVRSIRVHIWRQSPSWTRSFQQESELSVQLHDLPGMLSVHHVTVAFLGLEERCEKWDQVGPRIVAAWSQFAPPLTAFAPPWFPDAGAC